MKLLILLLSSFCCYGAEFQLDIVKLVKIAKTPEVHPLHKWVYIAEGLAAAASLGVDGWSTEVAVVQTPAKLRAQGYPCVPCITEANPLFLSNTPTSAVPQFSNTKFFAYKITLAAVPFAITTILHHYAGESTGGDVASLLSAGGLTALYTTAGIKNLDLAKRVTDENHAAGKVSGK